ncbi:MAG: methyl-accepting chemotaxis protein [Lachnospiraceae bacterium]|nr:methyl-accepting chemotaxis protein [Lachnospiraceae bacterium]
MNNETKEMPKVKKISGKLLSVILPVTFVGILVMVAVATLFGKNLITTLLNTSLEEKVNADAGAVNKDLSSTFYYLNGIADTVESQEFKNDAVLKKYLKGTMGRYDMIPTGTYIAFSNGDYVDPSDWEPDTDVREKGWYIEGMKHDDNLFYFYDVPYFDANTGKLCATVVRHVKLQDGRDGVLCSDLMMSAEQEYLNKVKVYGSGRAMMVTSQGLVLSYEKAESAGKNLSELTNDPLITSMEEVVKGDDGKVTTVKGKSEKYYAVAKTIDGTDWKVIIYAKASEVLADVFHMVYVVAGVIILLMIAIVVILSAAIKRLIRKPVAQLTENIEHITQGDFTVEIHEKGNDEIAYMNSTMKKFIENMRATISNIQEISSRLEVDSKKSRDTADVLKGEAKEQSNSMEDILQTMDNMAEAVTEVAEDATNLAQIVSDLTSAEEALQMSMQDLVGRADAGEKDMTKVSNGMGDVVTSMGEMNGAVQAVDEAAEQINKIVDMISNIASQTNLLSLNASIEAARAGEAGKGFAVVATEIGQLANDSDDATKQIAVIIQDMTQRVRELATKSEENTEMINGSAESVKNAAEIFSKITQSLGEASSTLDEMAAKMSNVNEVAMNMASVSEEQSASTEEITATITNLTESSKNVAESSNIVAHTSTEATEAADQLDESMRYFNI